jgi:hypothetical protein
MKKRMTFGTVLTGSLLAALLPGVAAADLVGDCPVNTGAAWALTSVAPPLADLTNVGSFADRNGDGAWCVRINGAGKAVWRDNTNPTWEE